MMYEDVIGDFAQRTTANLRAIRKMRSDGSPLPVYEVTQLVNSMLGLLVFPRERYVDRIPEIPIDALASDGWPIPEVMGSYPQAENLRELVRMLRNAVAHCNLTFEPGHGNEIEALTVWNTKSGKVTWKARLTVSDLDAITVRFAALLLDKNTYR